MECANGYIKPQLDTMRSKLCEKNGTSLNCVVTCPGTYHGHARNQCKCKINIRNIVTDTNSDLYIDIFRIIYVQDNPLVSICPNKECGNVVESLEGCTTCTNCNTRWCKWCHSIPYHDGMNCIEYEVKTGSNSNNSLILELYKNGKLKFCPQCNASTTKEKDINGNDIGCNKITCISCGERWCWLCNAKNIDYKHFSSGSCTNRLWDGVNIV